MSFYSRFLGQEPYQDTWRIFSRKKFGSFYQSSKPSLVDQSFARFNTFHKNLFSLTED